MRAIARLRTLEPGTGYLYSNANYVLLAEVVHRVSGEPLPEFLDEHIFTPLDLDMEVSPNLKAPDVAVSYDDFDQRQDSGWSAYGYSEIFSTPTELARWADQYRAGTIVADDFADGAVVMPDGAQYAAGIEIRADDSLRHDGRLGGHITTFHDLPRPRDRHRRHVQRPHRARASRSPTPSGRSGSPPTPPLTVP